MESKTDEVIPISGISFMKSASPNTFCSVCEKSVGDIMVYFVFGNHHFEVWHFCTEHLPQVPFLTQNNKVYGIVKHFPAMFLCFLCNRPLSYSVYCALPHLTPVIIKLKKEAETVLFKLDNTTEFHLDLCKQHFSSFLSVSSFVDYIKWRNNFDN
jgi:hypothetical protein